MTSSLLYRTIYTTDSPANFISTQPTSQATATQEEHDLFLCPSTLQEMLDIVRELSQK